jgi:hypothetical protein
MKDWLEDAIEQIALGEHLASSSLGCGPRFGLIAVDNSVEFMLKAYVELYKQLIGGHKPGGVTKKDWEEIKRQFPTLLSFVAGLEPKIVPLESDVSRFHDLRNDLYHSGLPLTTNPTRVGRYSKLARQLLEALYGVSYSATEWGVIVSKVGSSLAGEATSNGIRHQVTYELVEGQVKFTTSGSPTVQEAIALCLYGYGVLTGAPPSRPSIIQSLARSGHPISQVILNARLHDMKNQALLRSNELTLSAKGKKKVARDYML